MKSLKDYTYYVTVMPQNYMNFRPQILIWGVNLEKAQAIQHKYISDHGLRYFHKGKNYPCLITITKCSGVLPVGYQMARELI